MKESQQTPTSLAVWPGALGIFNSSRDAIRHNLNTVLLLTLGSMAAGFIVGLVSQVLFGKRFADTFGQAISYSVGIYFSVALTYVYIQSARRKLVDLKAAFDVVPPLFVKMFMLNVLIALSVIAGLLLLIVPGVIIALRLSLAPYYLVDQKLEPMDAYKASWHATKDHMGKLWGILGASLLMLLPIITIVGIIATIYLLFMYGAVLALLYLHITKTKHA